MSDLYEKERIKQSDYAPGPVSSEEYLIRAIYSPEHIDENGQLLESAIPSQDLLRRGFSVQRRTYINKAKIQNMIENYVSRKDGRSFGGLAMAVCESVRGILDDQGNQAFCVVDDAHQKNDIGHAIILCNKSYSKSKLKKLREKLLRIFNSLYSLDELFYPGRNE